MKPSFSLLIGFLLLFLLFFLPGPLWAGGPILVDSDVTGNPVLWQNGNVRYNLESGEAGTLGQLSNEDAVALVRELFLDWQVTLQDLSTTSLAFVEGDGLGAVDTSNLNDHFTYCPPEESCPSESAPFVVGSARTGASPILFDDDGSMTDAVQGTGASLSILGFAGPRVVERTDGVLYITEGQAILNGLFIDGTDTSSNPEIGVLEYKGAIFHELGHFMGIDHSQVNLASVVKYLNGDTSEKSAIPTMLPLFVDGEEQLSPHFDDKVAVSFLYPSSAFGSSFCRMEGTVFEADGATELQGVNVVASNAADPLLEATSFVSGSLFTGSSSGCEAGEGGFQLAGLTPGISYNLGIEKISQAFTGGSSIEPCDPAQSGFDAATVPGSFSCAAGGQVISAGTEATTTVITTKASTVAEEEGSGSSGGCSLVP